MIDGWTDIFNCHNMFRDMHMRWVVIKRYSNVYLEWCQVLTKAYSRAEKVRDYAYILSRSADHDSRLASRGTVVD